MQLRERRVWALYLAGVREEGTPIDEGFDEVYPVSIYQHAADCKKRVGSERVLSAGETALAEFVRNGITVIKDPKTRSQYDFFITELIDELNIMPKRSKVTYHIAYTHLWEIVPSTETLRPKSSSKKYYCPKKRQALASDEQYESAAKRLRSLR